ncbi:MAG: hypothetical protein M1824_000335 [Vezdaea acicularis]|nr:MAG: hypothetical protein M1824_000335 [Vezdaea acicularis]
MRVSPSFEVSLLTLFTIFFRLTSTLPHLDPEDLAYDPLFDDEDDTSSTTSDDQDLGPFVYSVHNSYFGSGPIQISGSSGTSGGSGGSGASGSASIPIIYPVNHPGLQLLHQPDISDWLVPQPGESDFLPPPPGLPTWPPDWSPSLRIDCDSGPVPDWDYAFPPPFATFPDPFSGHLTNLCAFHRGSGWKVTPAPPAGRGGMGGYCQEVGNDQIVLFKEELADERLWDTIPPSMGQALLATCMRYCECERRHGARKIADQDGWVNVREKDGEDVDVNASMLGVMVRLGNTQVTLAPGAVSPREDVHAFVEQRRWFRLTGAAGPRNAGV